MVTEVYEFLTKAGFKQGNLAMMGTAMDVFLSEVEELTKAARDYVLAVNYEEKEDARMEILDGLADVTFSMQNIPFFLGLSGTEVEKYEKCVIESNNTKFCVTEEQAKETVEAYANGTHPDKVGKRIETYYVKNDDTWVILRKKDNKVMKSKFYRPALDLFKE